MSRIYAGDMASIDTEVLEALKALPNDYWVLAGFTVGREVDWLIVRTARPMEHSAIIITELKRYEHNIRGISQDAVWERQDIDGEWHPIEGGYADRNPYWQAVNGANALKHWLMEQPAPLSRYQRPHNRTRRRRVRRVAHRPDPQPSRRRAPVATAPHQPLRRLGLRPRTLAVDAAELAPA